MYHTKMTANVSIGEPKRILRDHKIRSTSDVYRLHYIRYATDESKIRDVISWDYVPFRLPVGMDRVDLFEMLSHMVEKIADKYGVRVGSHECTTLLNAHLDDLKVERVPDATDVIPLFVVDGDKERFKRGAFVKQYHRWYIPDVSEETARKLYQKYDLYTAII